MTRVTRRDGVTEQAFFFPGSAQVLSHEETAEGEKAVADEINPDDHMDDPKNAGTDNGGYEIKSDGREDNSNETPDTDREVTLTNQFLPSAMGITALVEVSQDSSLLVDVSAGTYGKEKIQGSEVWKRQRIKRSINIAYDELVGGKNKGI